MAASAIAATSLFAQTSSDSLRKTYDALHRVISIKERISKANIDVCKKRTFTYGFSHLSLSGDVAPEVRTMWAATFPTSSSPTVIYVDPKGPAARAGLQASDAIISVNGGVWPEQSREQIVFLKGLSDVKATEPRLSMVVGRKGDDLAIEMTADLVCDINVKLITNEKTSAHAGGNTISFDSGIDRLLSEEAELAFVVAHEMAHVILEHNPEKSGSISRAKMETDADHLGMELFLAAGYNPDYAASAIRKLDAANRGPITKLLGIYGPYLSTEKRVQFLSHLATQATKAKPSFEVPIDR